MNTNATLLSISSQLVHDVGSFRLAIVELFKVLSVDLGPCDAVPNLSRADIDSLMEMCAKQGLSEMLIPLIPVIIQLIIEEAGRKSIVESQ
jgi:hypothetical protein